MNAYREVEFSDMLPPAKNLKITSLAFQIILLLFFSGLWMPWTCARPSVLRAWTLYTLCDPHLDVLVSWSFLFWLLKNTVSYSYVGELGESKNARKKRKVVCPDTFPRPPPMRFGSLYPTRRVNILLRLRSCDLLSPFPAATLSQLRNYCSVFCTYDLLNFSTTECGLVCHVKCAPNLPRTCGLPSQFVEHFSETLQEQKDDENDKPNVQSSTRLGGRREGWLRVPRYDIAIHFL